MRNLTIKVRCTFLLERNLMDSGRTGNAMDLGSRHEYVGRLVRGNGLRIRCRGSLSVVGMILELEI